MKRDYAYSLLRKNKENYNKIFKDFSATRRNVWWEIKFLFDKYVFPGQKILDLGCGNGRFFEIFKNKSVEYIGVDFSENLIAIAKERFPQAKFIVADALSLPFPDEFFDVVFSIAVLHHIPSQSLRALFLSEIKRVLKKDGILILTVWDFEVKMRFSDKVKNFLLRLTGKLDRGDYFRCWGQKAEIYFHKFSKSEIEKLLRQSGFIIWDIGIVKNKRGNRSNIYLVAKK